MPPLDDQRDLGTMLDILGMWIAHRARMEANSVDTKTQLSGEPAFEKVRALLTHFKSAMMVTHAPNGDLHVRPLALQGDLSAFGGVLWFFTDARSRKVDEAADGLPVSLICQSDEQSAYLHLAGTATVVRDVPKMRELYSPILKTWFPKGLDDPNLVLMKFEASRGDFWESPGGLLQTAAAFATSVITGAGRKGGEAGELNL
jgi:general stress protein 26